MDQGTVKLARFIVIIAAIAMFTLTVLCVILVSKELSCSSKREYPTTIVLSGTAPISSQPAPAPPRTDTEER